MNSVQNLFASSTDGAISTFTNLSLDTIILATVFLAFFIFGLKFGKRNIISLLLSLYVSIPIMLFFPYLQKISFLGETNKTVLYSQIGLFVLIVIFINIVLSRLMSFELYNRGLRRLIENGIIALASSGLLITISYHIINVSELYDFAGQIDAVFASTTMLFWWMIAPLVVIFFTTRG